MIRKDRAEGKKGFGGPEIVVGSAASPPIVTAMDGRRAQQSASRCLPAYLAALLAAAIVFVAPAPAQTQPAPLALPHAQDFGTAAFSTMPPGFAAWSGLNGATISSASAASTSIPTADAAVTAATSEKSNGGSYGLPAADNGRFYIQTSGNSGNGTNQPAMAIDTTCRTDVTRCLLNLSAGWCRLYGASACNLAYC